MPCCADADVHNSTDTCKHRRFWLEPEDGFILDESTRGHESLRNWPGKMRRTKNTGQPRVRGLNRGTKGRSLYICICIFSQKLLQQICDNMWKSLRKTCETATKSPYFCGEGAEHKYYDRLVYTCTILVVSFVVLQRQKVSLLFPVKQSEGLTTVKLFLFLASAALYNITWSLYPFNKASF